MTIAFVCIFKVLMDIISASLKYYQQDNFNLAIVGVYLDFATSKGQLTMFVILLQTVADARASSVAAIVIALF